MAVDSRQVSVGTTATELTATDLNTRYETNGYSSSLVIKNPTGGQTVYIGDSTVTTSNGYALEAGDVLPLDLRPNDRVYGRVAATTQTVGVLRTDI